MIEYRQYVPEDRAADSAFVSEISMNVCHELSRQASETEDDDEFFVKALTNLTKRKSRNGGFWIHSFLDVPRKADYLQPGFEGTVSDLPLAKVREPVDFTEDELAEHMARKRGTNVG